MATGKALKLVTTLVVNNRMVQHSSPSSLNALRKLEKELKKELAQVETSDPCHRRLKDILSALQLENQKHMTILLLEQTQIASTVRKTIKAIRRQKRSCDAEEQESWTGLLQTGQRLISDWKAITSASKNSNKQQVEVVDKNASGLPKSVASYHRRLTTQKKDMFKNPPALPPAAVIVEDAACQTPKRCKKTGALTFPAGNDNDSELKRLLRDFHPNRTPKEVLHAGSFGGTYFRPIVSAVTNLEYKAEEVLSDTLALCWMNGLDKKTMLTSSTYRTQVNKYGVKCGGSLGMWESSGWISDADPYGWFQWYCRFYQGRRCSDDCRQISRWLKCAGPKGRFRSQLCNKVLAAQRHATDESVSPVIRQTLLHWGLELTPELLEQHKRRTRI